MKKDLAEAKAITARAELELRRFEQERLMLFKQPAHSGALPMLDFANTQRQKDHN